MMYGIIAIASIFHYLGKQRQVYEAPTLPYFDYHFPHAELKFRRNEIDSIEKELIEIEADLRIVDEFSHIREVTLQAQKLRLKTHLSRHKERLTEIE